MAGAPRTIVATLVLLWVPATAPAADLAGSVPEICASPGKTRAEFEPGAASLPGGEARFLTTLFELADEAALLNVDVACWFVSEGGRGLHPADYGASAEALAGRLDALETPARVASVRPLVAEALRLQRSFVAEWYAAVEAGRPFESQLSSEFGFHHGLHLSHRKLLQAFAELHALYPQAGDDTHRAFHDHLCALDFL